jgi:hypothetical protein
MKLSNKWPKIAMAFIGGLAISSTYNACGEAFQTKSQLSHSLSSVAPGDSTVLVSPLVTTLETELAEVRKISVSILSVNGFSGAVDLKVNTPEFDAIDPLDGLKITVSPSRVTVPQNGTAIAEVTIDVGTASPSAIGHFHIEAYQAGTQLILNEGDVDLTIKPIFRIKVAGVGDLNWRVGQTTKTFLDVPAKTLNFIPHATGLQVIFENYSTTVDYIIHSGGAINHQDTNNPMARSANGVAPGGAYTPAKIMGNTPTNALVYLHNGEGSGASRRLNFNMQ